MKSVSNIPIALKEVKTTNLGKVKGHIPSQGRQVAQPSPSPKPGAQARVHESRPTGSPRNVDQQGLSSSPDHTPVAAVVLVAGQDTMGAGVTGILVDWPCRRMMGSYGCPG